MPAKKTKAKTKKTTVKKTKAKKVESKKVGVKKTRAKKVEAKKTKTKKVEAKKVEAKKAKPVPNMSGLSKERVDPERARIQREYEIRMEKHRIRLEKKAAFEAAQKERMPKTKAQEAEEIKEQERRARKFLKDGR